MCESSLKLRRATASGVLGEYEHSFSIDQASNFALIYGPNGVGKTKFLEIIDALSQLNGYNLSRLPFERSVLEYSDGSRLFAERKEMETETAEELSISFYSIHFTLRRPNEDPLSWDHADDGFIAFIRKRLQYEPISDEYWQSSPDGEVIHIDELRAEYDRMRSRRAHLTDRNRTSRNQKTDQTQVPAAAQAFVDLVPSFLIETQRLRIELSPDLNSMRLNDRRELKKYRPQITEQAERMRSLLNDAQTEHSHITQRLDRSFPHRVLVADSDEEVPDEKTVRERYIRQNEFASRLGRIASISLDDELSLPKRNLNSTEVKLLDQYFEDAETKLAPFHGLMQKIELLEGIINDRLLNKSLRVTDEQGLSVTHTRTRKAIPLASLSSGEQHVIILMMDLLFNVPSGALVLVDEPEISLHVAWQIAFIPDVEQISELVGFQFVVATHSPQIINDEWDRAVSLGSFEE